MNIFYNRMLRNRSAKASTRSISISRRTPSLGKQHQAHPDARRHDRARGHVEEPVRQQPLLLHRVRGRHPLNLQRRFEGAETDSEFVESTACRGLPERGRPARSCGGARLQALQHSNVFLESGKGKSLKNSNIARRLTSMTIEDAAAKFFSRTANLVGNAIGRSQSAITQGDPRPAGVHAQTLGWAT